MHFNIPLRIVFYKEESEWVAHCLEFDLLGDGATQEDAMHCLAEAIVLQLESSIEHNDPGILFSPAPGEYLQKFAAGKDVASGKLQIAFRGLADRFAAYDVEDPQLREYSQSEEDQLTFA